MGGYHLTVCPPAAQALASHAASTNKIFVLNLSAPFIPQFFKDPLDALAPLCDYILGNESEAAAWGAGHGLEGKSVAEIAKAIADGEKTNKKRQRIVIITQGTEPTVVAVQGEESVKEYPVHALKKEHICDTNGAGLVLSGFPQKMVYYFTIADHEMP